MAAQTRMTCVRSFEFSSSVLIVGRVRARLVSIKREAK